MAENKLFHGEVIELESKNFPYQIVEVSVDELLPNNGVYGNRLEARDLEDVLFFSFENWRMRIQSS